jgi:hypothetical protein
VEWALEWVARVVAAAQAVARVVAAAQAVARAVVAAQAVARAVVAALAVARAVVAVAVATANNTNRAFLSDCLAESEDSAFLNSGDNPIFESF